MIRALFYDQRIVTHGSSDGGRVEKFRDVFPHGWRIVKWEVAAVKLNHGCYHYTTAELVRPRKWFKTLTLGVAR